jgi:hypothetical protein
MKLYICVSNTKYATSCDTSSKNEKNSSSNDNAIDGKNIQGSDLKIMSYANVCKVIKPKIEKIRTIEERTWYELLVFYE